MKKLHLLTSLAFTSLLFFGNAQTAIDLNGSNQYTQTLFSPVISTYAFTIEMDVYPKGGDAANDRLFSMNYADYFEVAVDATGTVRLWSNICGIYGWTVITTIPLNTYSHLAISHEPGQIKVYVNGTEVTTLTALSNYISFNVFFLGADGLAVNQNSNVRMDNFRFWNTARTATQISDNRFSCLLGTEPNLVVLYRFDEGSGTTAVDAAPLQGTNNATLINGVLWTGNVACSAVCASPSIPAITASSYQICSGSTTTLNISGALNDATQWNIYTGSCGGTLVGTTATSSFVVNPTTTTTYYVRGEGGCVAPGACSTVTIEMNANVANQTVTTASFESCNADTTIGIAGSQIGVNYYLRNDANNSVLAGPVAGTGGPITFNTGAVTATTTYNVLGNTPATSVLNFDGVDDFVQMNTTSLFDMSTQISIEAWIKPSSGIITQNVISKSSNVENSGYIFPRTDDNWTNFSAYLHVDGSWKVVSAPYPNLNEWHHVAVTFDGAMIRLYLDGIEVDNLLAWGTIQTNTNPLVFGNQSGYGEFYKGQLDDVRIWNDTRTPTEIASNYFACLSGSESNLVALYKLDEGSGLSVTEQTNGLNGTMQNMNASTSWAATGHVSNCNLCESEMSQTPTITVSGSTSDTSVVSACGSYTWAGNSTTYTTSGVYTETYLSSTGCDSILVLDLTIESIQDQAVSIADTAICVVNMGTTVSIASSEVGTDYYLRDNNNDTIVDGHYAGSNGALSFTTGSISADMTYNVYAARPGESVVFDGMNDRVAFDGTLLPTGNTARTIEFWFSTLACSGTLFNNGDSSTFISMDSYGSGEIWYHEPGMTNYFAQAGFTGSIQGGNWHHLAITYDGTTTKMYANGVEIFSRLELTPFTTVPTDSVFLGNGVMGPAQLTKMSNFRYWDTALSASEIQAAMLECSPSSPSLIAGYNFKSGSATMSDLSANGNNATLQNFDLPNAFDVSPVNCSDCNSEMSTLVSVSLLQNLTGTDTITACDSYTWIDGNTYTASNNSATYVVQNGAGCDSTVTLDLTIITISPETIHAGSTDLCVGNTGTNISLPTNQIGVNYTLYDAIADTIIDGPLVGTGNILDFNTGPLSSTMTFKVIGENPTSATGTAIALDGVDDYLEISQTGPYSYPGQSWSHLEAWVYLESYGDGATIIECQGAYHFFIDSIGRMHFSNNYGNYGMYWDEFDSTIAPLPLNQWVNIAVRRDVFTFFYINGALAGISNTDAFFPFFSEDLTTTVGGTYSSSAMGGTIDGAIDELAFFNNFQAIADLSCIDAADPTLVRFFDFNEGSGNFAVSYAGLQSDTLNMQSMNPTTAWGQGIQCGTCSAEMMNQVTVNVSAPTTSSTTVTECDSYTWNGTTYNATGVYTWIGTNAAGCDSTVTLDLTILNSIGFSMSITACDSFTWHGTNYTASGGYFWTTTNAVGCDSVVQLNLTINNSSASTTTLTECDAYSWNGTTYNATGVYTWAGTNAVGCDSTATLNLTINNSSTSTSAVTECDAYSWNGTTYNTSGVYTWTGTNASGCDSTATLNLTINNSSTSTSAVTECDAYSWNGTTYNATGVYTWTGTNASGCDSTATLNLTINSVDAGITSSGLTITADLAGASYQWIDCGNGNAVITGATSQSYTATANGDYAVIVTSNNCSDTSNCITIDEVGLVKVNAATFKLYPNPTSNFVTIEFGASQDGSKVELRDARGRLLTTMAVTDETVHLDLTAYETGVYFVVISFSNGEQIERVVKH